MTDPIKTLGSPRVIDRFIVSKYLTGKTVIERPLQHHHTLGIGSNIYKECSFNGFLWGDNKQAFGLCQWHPARRRDFKRWFGKDMAVSTVWEQLDFILMEMNHTERRAGRELLEATTAYDAAAAFSRWYERPRRVEHEMKVRGELAQKWWEEDNGRAGVHG